MFLRINYFPWKKTVPLKLQSFAVLLALNLRSAYFMHTISKINSISFSLSFSSCLSLSFATRMQL